MALIKTHLARRVDRTASGFKVALLNFQVALSAVLLCLRDAFHPVGRHLPPVTSISIVTDVPSQVVIRGVVIMYRNTHLQNARLSKHLTRRDQNHGCASSSHLDEESAKQCPSLCCWPCWSTTEDPLMTFEAVVNDEPNMFHQGSREEKRDGADKSASGTPGTLSSLE